MENPAELPPSRFPWPPVILVSTGALAVLLGWVLPLPWLPSPLSDVLFAIGWMILALVAFVDIRAMIALRAARTTIMPHRTVDHLVTNGPFAISRNPIYVGYVMILIAAALISANPWFLPLALVDGFVTRKLAIDPEERHIEAKFGRRYRDYAKKVRRWI